MKQKNILHNGYSLDFSHKNCSELESDFRTFCHHKFKSDSTWKCFVILSSTLAYYCWSNIKSKYRSRMHATYPSANVHAFLFMWLQRQTNTAHIEVAMCPRGISYTLYIYLNGRQYRARPSVLMVIYTERMLISWSRHECGQQYWYFCLTDRGVQCTAMSRRTLDPPIFSDMEMRSGCVLATVIVAAAAGAVVAAVNAIFIYGVWVNDAWKCSFYPLLAQKRSMSG